MCGIRCVCGGICDCRRFEDGTVDTLMGTQLRKYTDGVGDNKENRGNTRNAEDLDIDESSLHIITGYYCCSEGRRNDEAKDAPGMSV